MSETTNSATKFSAGPIWTCPPIPVKFDVTFKVMLCGCPEHESLKFVKDADAKSIPKSWASVICVYVKSPGTHGSTVGEGEGLGLGVGLGEGLASALGLGEGLASALGLGEGLALAPGLGDGLGLGDASGDGLAPTLGAGDGLEPGEALAPGEGVTVVPGPGDWLAPPPGASFATIGTTTAFSPTVEAGRALKMPIRTSATPVSDAAAKVRMRNRPMLAPSATSRCCARSSRLAAILPSRRQPAS